MQALCPILLFFQDKKTKSQPYLMWNIAPKYRADRLVSLIIEPKQKQTRYYRFSWVRNQDSSPIQLFYARNSPQTLTLEFSGLTQTIDPDSKLH